MKKRQYSQTSKDAHDSVKDHKAAMYKKIIEGLKKLKIGGNFEEISIAAGIKPEQCWKRLPELQQMGVIYNCGYTRSTSSGRQSMVRQLIGLGYKHEDKTPVKPVVKKKAETQLQMF